MKRIIQTWRAKGANGKSDATRSRILTIIGSRLSANETEQSVKWSGSVRERFVDYVGCPWSAGNA